jgi:hypothetical protein
MQTFMPSVNYTETASMLDNKRLNKQALEGWQILMNLLELDPEGNYRAPKGWSNHPAVKMWRGYEWSLYTYIQEMVKEWKRRGFKSTIGDKATKTFLVFNKRPLTLEHPDWLEDMRTSDSVTSSHRLALLVKDYEWYSQFGWEEDPGYPPVDYEYTWPVE